jgi:hypothetical protein
LTRAHVRDLALLEIRVHIQPRGWNDGHELGANGRIGPVAGPAVADNALNRRADFRVAQVKPCQVKGCLCLGERGLSLFFLGRDDRQLAFRGNQGGPCRVVIRPGFGGR